MCDWNLPDTVVRTLNGRPTVFADPCISDLVGALNCDRLSTVASCCGHGHRPGSVVLGDGRELLIVTEAQARELDKVWPDIHGAVA